ncbi:MAG TPA: VWA domain-containing protein [Anaerolineales bacterium]|nr:VWA domain-containing protein [Anaerolineales bacterium]
MFFKKYFFWIVVFLSSTIFSFLSAQWLETANLVPAIEHPASDLAGLQVDDAYKVEVDDYKRRDVDVMVAFDISGSMKTHDSGAQSLEAAALIASSLADDIFPRTTHMGAIAFGQDAYLLQPMQLLDDPGKRTGIIESLYRRDDQDCNPKDVRCLFPEDQTNMSGALDIADAEFARIKAENPDSANIPVLILFTDGAPATNKADNDVETILARLDKMGQDGRMVFIFVLQVPSDSKSTTSEEDKIKAWIEGLQKVDTANANVESLIIEDPVDAINSYNDIVRSRLVQEGAVPGERTEYDPQNISPIILPPNLLLAQLVVGKPEGTSVLDLKNSAGQLFDPNASNVECPSEINGKPVKEDCNSISDNMVYKKFRMYLPTAGEYQLNTDATRTLYYILNYESRFNVVPAYFGERPVIFGNQAADFGLAITDENGAIEQTIAFDLSVQILDVSKFDQPERLLYETTIPQSALDAKYGIYKLSVPHESLKDVSQVLIKVAGTSPDGSFVNHAQLFVPVVNAPTNPQFQLVAPANICDDNGWQILRTPARWLKWQFACNNQTFARLKLENINTLQYSRAFVWNPTLGEKGDWIEMTLKGDLFDGPIALPNKGDYEICAYYEGDAAVVAENMAGNDALHIKSAPFCQTATLDWPTWVKDWQPRWWLAVWLSAIACLWKFLVKWLLQPLLIWLFGKRMGGFALNFDHTKNDSLPAFKRKLADSWQLFTLTVGEKSNNNVSANFSDTQGKSKNKNTILGWLNLSRWLTNQRVARIRWIPFWGIQMDTINGTKTADNAPNLTSCPTDLSKDTIYIQKG